MKPQRFTINVSERVLTDVRAFFRRFRRA